MQKGKLKQKHIETFLDDIQDFEFGEKEKIMMEQHRTPPQIAAQLLFHVYQNEPIESYICADIGVGTGMLTCGLIYIGSMHTIGIQLDQKYIHIAKSQLQEKVQGSCFDLINADVTQIKLRDKTVDLVVMNPPFGTKQAGIDMKFVQLAMKICSGNIYSMHKSSTRQFIAKFCEERGYSMEVIFEVKFPLVKRFKKYHKKQVGFTEVDILLIKPHVIQ